MQDSIACSMLVSECIFLYYVYMYMYIHMHVQFVLIINLCNSIIVLHWQLHSRVMETIFTYTPTLISLPLSPSHSIPLSSLSFFLSLLFSPPPLSLPLPLPPSVLV